MFQLFYWIGRQNNRKKPCTQTSQKTNKLTCKYISSCLCLWSSRCCCLKSSSLRRSSSSLRCSSSWRRISSCLLMDRQKQNISHWLRFWAGSICLVQNLSGVMFWPILPLEQICYFPSFWCMIILWFVLLQCIWKIQNCTKGNIEQQQKSFTIIQT